MVAMIWSVLCLRLGGSCVIKIRYVLLKHKHRQISDWLIFDYLVTPFQLLELCSEVDGVNYSETV